MRERILGPAHPDTSYYIRYRGAVYADMGHFERCITLWMYALDMQQKMLEPLSPMTQSSLLSFAELFSFMMSEGRVRGNSFHEHHNVTNRNDDAREEEEGAGGEGNNQAVASSGPRRRRPPVNFCDIMTVFDKAVDEVRAGRAHVRSDRDATYFNRTLVIILHLVCLLTRLSPHLTSAQVHRARRGVFAFLQLRPRGRRGATPLHLACSRESSSVGRYPICQFPSVEAIKLLVECGADANARDDENNTPLHVSAFNRPTKPTVAAALLEAGAHLDTINADSKTFAQLLKGQQLHEVVNPLKHTNLQCLAARAIKKNKVAYKGLVSPALEQFVDQH